MTNILDNNIDIEPTLIHYNHNTVSYKDDILTLKTVLCKVINIKKDKIWIEISDQWLINLVKAIDINKCSSKSKNIQEYTEFMSQVKPSLSLSLAGNYTILEVKTRSYTEYYGDVTIGSYVRLILTANYSSSIIWNAIKIKSYNTFEKEPDFLQECQLEQKLINI